MKWNGKDLEDEKTYTVAFISNDYSVDFPEDHVIQDTGVLVVDAAAEYIAENSPV